MARKRGTITFADLDFPLRNEQNDFLPRLWASRRVGWLIEQIRANGETKELRDEVTELGTRYGIVTPYTSYLATDGTYQQFDDKGSGHKWHGLPAAKAMRDQNGAGAVQQSVQQNTMQSNMSVSPAKRKTPKNRCWSKILFLRNLSAIRISKTKTMFGSTPNTPTRENCRR